MERKNHLISGLIIATTLACAGRGLTAEEPAPAAQMESPHFGMMHMHRDADGSGFGPGNWTSRLEALNVTAEQKSAIQQVVQSYRDRGFALAQAASSVRTQWMNVSPDDPYYAQSTEEAATAAANLVADGIRLAGDMRAEVYALFTPEQRAQLRVEMSQERQRWEDWRKRHQPQQ